jgi:hypothetical protein
MLVSSRTLSLWVNWDNVPKHIQDLFPERKSGDLILFVPDVLRNSLRVAVILKIFEAEDNKEVPYGSTGNKDLSAGNAGIVYVRKGETVEEKPALPKSS